MRADLIQKVSALAQRNYELQKTAQSLAEEDSGAPESQQQQPRRPSRVATPFRDRPASVQAAQRAAVQKQLAAEAQARKQPPSRESFITKFHDPVQLGQGLYGAKKAVTEMPGHLREALRREQEHISGLADTVKTDAGRTLEKGRQVAKQLGDTGRQMAESASKKVDKGIDYVGSVIGDTGRQMVESASKKVDKGIDYVDSVRSAYNQARLRDKYGRRKLPPPPRKSPIMQLPDPASLAQKSSASISERWKQRAAAQKRKQPPPDGLK